jgi:hypothetical protein
MPPRRHNNRLKGYDSLAVQEHAGFVWYDSLDLFM